MLDLRGSIPPISARLQQAVRLYETLSKCDRYDFTRFIKTLYFTQNPDTSRPDTTAVEYVLRNNNVSSRSVGLRLMLDVMVGDNDGAPYFIEGTGQVTQQAEWIGADVPDDWISYESASFASDSLKGRGQLSVGDT